MVINCPECSTKFRVSAEKIPAKGAKLRCARCRHIFFVVPEEETPASPTVETPATSVSIEESAPAPGSSDFAPPESSFSTEDSPAESDFALDADSPSMDDPFDDSDFGFEDVPAAEEPAASPDDAFGGPTTVTGSSTDEIDFGFEDEPSSSLDTNETEPGSDSLGGEAPPEIGAGVNDEFDASAFEDGTAVSEDAFSFDEDYGNLDMGEEEESGSDFSFDEETDETDNAFAGTEPDPIEEISNDEAASGFSEEAPVPDTFQEEATPRDSYAPMEDDSYSDRPPESAPARKKRGPFATLILFLMVLILGIVIAGGVLYWQSGPEALVQIYQRLTGQEVTAPYKGQISVKNLRGSFVTNRVDGEFLVIQGNAVNEFRESRAAIQVKGVLFDEQGNQLRQKTIFCGNPITIEDLRQLPYDRLEEIMGNQFGESLVNLNVTPGQVIPFTIVFRDIPDNLSEFVVEVADSNPAAQ